MQSAWALSVHKSQGQTLERVRVDLQRTFECGQGEFFRLFSSIRSLELTRLSFPSPLPAYVAISRCVSMESLQVRSKLSLPSLKDEILILVFVRFIGIRSSTSRPQSSSLSLPFSLPFSLPRYLADELPALCRVLFQGPSSPRRAQMDGGRPGRGRLIGIDASRLSFLFDSFLSFFLSWDFIGALRYFALLSFGSPLFLYTRLLVVVILVSL